jgi:anti-anti-sigma regulatory factor
MFRLETIPNNEAVLVIGGPLSGEAVAEFEKKMQALNDGKFLTITLDFSQTPTVNSAAIGKILHFRKKLLEEGKTLQIRGCSEGLMKIFKMIRLDALVRITG